jgi:hypothetical protein
LEACWQARQLHQQDPWAPLLPLLLLLLLPSLCMLGLLVGCQ